MLTLTPDQEITPTPRIEVKIGVILGIRCWDQVKFGMMDVFHNKISGVQVV
jgi:hypothetical protein